MASYIGKVTINGTNEALVGSTLYGICNTAAGTAAKTVGSSDTSSTDLINTNYDRLVRGTTIHVKFNNGNTATSGVTLAVGTTLAKTVVGIHECAAGTILSFTLDESENWVANDNIDTNTEYVFKTAYNASTNRVLSEADVGDAAEKDIVTSLSDSTTATDLPTANAVVQYVQTKTAGLSGLTGAMHFRGSINPLPDATASSTYTTYDSGDVVLGPNDKEYVYVKGNDAASSQWIELGDEGSYVLQTSQTTDVIDEVTAWNDGTLPQLTVTPVSIPNVTSAGSAPSLTVTPVSIPNVESAGSATTASVTAGVLNITIGSAPTLGTAISVGSASDWNAGSAPTLGTAISVGSASNWNAGAKPSLTQTPTTVVVPVTTP